MRKVLNCAALAVLAVLALASYAAAATRSTSSLTIRGRGYGHGVGMSQFGALGLARHGVGYRDILTHYYTGTALGRLAPAPEVRVLLAQGKRSVAFTGATHVGDRPLDPAKTYSIVRSAVTQLALRSPSGRKLATYESPMRVEGDPATPMVLKGVGAYRGAFEFRAGLLVGVNAINAVGLEDYVRGVVGRESPSAWPADALAAQAVAARTYAVTTSAGAGQGFDQYPDQRSQVYGGVAAETPSTLAAVRATEGEVVTYGGKPVVTYFFSTSGGKTENVENSFVGSSPKPWLRGVDDPYDDASPKHVWGPIKMTGGQAKRVLAGLVKGSFLGIKVERRGFSPRIVNAEILGSRGITQVTGPALRKRFRLNDTWAYFRFLAANVKKSPSVKSTPAPSTTTPTDTTPTTPVDPTGGAAPPPPPAARAAAGAASPRPRYAVLSGYLVPAPRGSRLRVQSRINGQWWTVVSARIGKYGRYRASLPGPGQYRVLRGKVTGPVLTVR